MAARHFTLPVAAVAVRLSDVYGDGVGVVDAAHDLPYRQILLQAAVDGGTVFVGESTVTTADYGVAVPTAVANPPIVSIGPYETGPVKLSQLYAIATDTVLHILAIPF